MADAEWERCISNGMNGLGISLLRNKKRLYVVLYFMQSIWAIPSQSQMDDIIYNQLPPSHHHNHLAPFSFSSRSWTTTTGLASWVHHLQCASLQITICHKCNNVHPAQGIFAIWCTGRHKVVVTSVLFHILHFSASWPCFDPADHGRLLTDHTKPLIDSHLQ